MMKMLLDTVNGRRYRTDASSHAQELASSTFAMCARKTQTIPRCLICLAVERSFGWRKTRTIRLSDEYVVAVRQGCWVRLIFGIPWRERIIARKHSVFASELTVHTFHV